MLRSHIALLYIRIYVTISKCREEEIWVKVAVEVPIYGEVLSPVQHGWCFKVFSTLNYVVLTVDNYLEEDCKRISLWTSACLVVWVLLFKMMWKLWFKKSFENTYLKYSWCKKCVRYYISNNVFSKLKKHNCVIGICVCVWFFFFFLFLSDDM